MARGFADIKLVGGERDGEILEGVLTRMMHETIHLDSDLFFAEAEDGKVEVRRRNKGKLGTNWHSFSSDVYTKADNQKNESGVTYIFVEALMVERCEANTKAGKRCMKPANSGKTHCSTHRPK